MRYPETATAPLYQNCFPRLTIWATRAVGRLYIQAYPLSLIVSLLVSWGLQLRLLNRFPLREDEAIYSYWAIHAWRADPFFMTVWPDKPPLFLWLLGGAFQLWGANPAAGRLLNIAITELTILVIAALARRLWGNLVGGAAAVAASLNPFTISFAATIYTDPLLVFAGCTALYMALTRCSFWAGVWLGIAIMTKQQGVLYFPLIVGILFLPPPRKKDWETKRPRDQETERLRDRETERPRDHATTRPCDHATTRPRDHATTRRHDDTTAIPASLRHWGALFIGFATVCGPIIYLDSLRWAVAPSPWDLSIRNYGALTLTPLTQWPERLYAWSNLSWYLTASWPVWALMALSIVGIRAVCNRSYVPPPNHFVILSSCHPITLSPCHLVTLWGAAFFALHVVTTVQIWDRYLLPLAPLVALAIGWVTAQIYTKVVGAKILGEKFGGRWLLVFAVVVLLLASLPALTASGGGLPIGADHGAYTGLDEAVAWLQHAAPGRAILYHHRLGWHDRFYFYDAVATERYRLRWFPHTLKLAQDAAAVPYRRRFILAPVWAPMRDLPQQLAIHRLRIVQERRFGQMLVYEIANRPAFPCSWCLCVSHLPKHWLIQPQVPASGGPP